MPEPRLSTPVSCTVLPRRFLQCFQQPARQLQLVSFKMSASNRHNVHETLWLRLAQMGPTRCAQQLQGMQIKLLTFAHRSMPDLSTYCTLVFDYQASRDV